METLSIFSASYFLIENVLYSELIICCYNMDIKDLLPPKVILGYELIATRKAIMLIAATKSDELNNID